MKIGRGCHFSFIGKHRHLTQTHVWLRAHRFKLSITQSHSSPVKDLMATTPVKISMSAARRRLVELEEGVVSEEEEGGQHQNGPMTMKHGGNNQEDRGDHGRYMGTPNSPMMAHALAWNETTPERVEPPRHTKRKTTLMRRYLLSKHYQQDVAPYLDSPDSRLEPRFMDFCLKHITHNTPMSGCQDDQQSLVDAAIGAWRQQPGGWKTTTRCRTRTDKSTILARKILVATTYKKAERKKALEKEEREKTQKEGKEEK